MRIGAMIGNAHTQYCPLCVHACGSTYVSIRAMAAAFADLGYWEY